MTTLEKIQQEIKAFEDKKKALFEELQKELPKMFIPLFEKSKLIESIGFVGYVPYFNDGDECVYSLNIDELYINGEYEDEIKWFDWRIRYYLDGKDEYKNLLEENPQFNVEEWKIVEDFKDALRMIPDEFFQTLFGSHQKVTIFKNGDIKNEEYDHD